MIKAVIFDFDGALVESAGIKTRAFAKLFEKEKKSAVNRIVKYHLKNSGVSRFKKFRFIYPRILKRPLPKAEYRYLCKRFSGLVVDEVVNAPFVLGAKEFLAECSKSYNCFIVTATPQKEMEGIIRRRGMRRYFKRICGAPMRKETAVAKIISREGIRPQEAVYIGDALADYKAAKKNSVIFIARAKRDDTIFSRIKCLKIKDFRRLRLMFKHNEAGHKKN